jgi:hypothetical protein
MSDYETERAVSENTRQNSKRQSNTAAGHLAADIAHYQTLVLLGRAYNIRNGAAQALANLGGAMPGGSWQKGDA